MATIKFMPRKALLGFFLMIHAGFYLNSVLNCSPRMDFFAYKEKYAVSED